MPDTLTPIALIHYFPDLHPAPSIVAVTLYFLSGRRIYVVPLQSVAPIFAQGENKVNRVGIFHITVLVAKLVWQLSVWILTAPLRQFGA